MSTVYHHHADTGESSWSRFKKAFNYGFRETYTAGRFLPWFTTMIVYSILAGLTVLAISAIPTFADPTLGWTWLLLIIMGLLLFFTVAGFTTLFHIFGLNTVRGEPIRPYEDVKKDNFWAGFIAHSVNSLLILIPTAVVLTITILPLLVFLAPLTAYPAFSYTSEFMLMSWIMNLAIFILLPIVTIISSFFQFTVFRSLENLGPDYVGGYTSAVGLAARNYFPVILIVLVFTLLMGLLSFTVVGPYMLIIPMYSSLAYLYRESMGAPVEHSPFTDYSSHHDSPVRPVYSHYEKNESPEEPEEKSSTSSSVMDDDISNHSSDDSRVTSDKVKKEEDEVNKIYSPSEAPTIVMDKVQDDVQEKKDRVPTEPPLQHEDNSPDETGENEDFMGYHPQHVTGNRDAIMEVEEDSKVEPFSGDNPWNYDANDSTENISSRDNAVEEAPEWNENKEYPIVEDNPYAKNHDDNDDSRGVSDDDRS